MRIKLNYPALASFINYILIHLIIAVNIANQRKIVKHMHPEDYALECKANPFHITDQST